MTGPEIQAILCPVDDEHVVVIHRAEDSSLVEGLGGVVLDAVLTKLSGAGPQISTIQTRLFSTTPELERLLNEGHTYDAKSAPGHFLPAVLDDQGHYLRQVPLKEVDPSLLASAGAVNPAVLATVVATQVLLRRLQVMEDLIREVRADTAELIDREDAQQRAQLRTVLMDLADFGGFVDSTDDEWRMVQGHRDTLTDQHGEIVEEIQRLSRQLNQHPSLTRGWASLTTKQADRLDMLIQLETLVIDGLERWTATYLLRRPPEGAARNALERIQTLRGEASRAISLIPAQPLPAKPAYTTVLQIGPIRASKNLAKARDNQETALRALPVTIKSMQASGKPEPLQIMA